MKHTAQKKQKVFRTLIRMIHIDDNSGVDESHFQVQVKRTKSEKQSRSFSFSAGEYENT